MMHTRRKLLKFGGFVVTAAAAGTLARPLRAASIAAASARGPAPGAAQGDWGRAKRVALRNLHTSESLDVEFFRDGAYLPEAMSAVEVLLRDYRNDARHPIEPSLLDYLVDVAARAGVDPEFKVISGYRSPQTNEMLHERSGGVATHSLHMQGRAIDVRLAGVGCADLATQALTMTRGGVGYYRKSDFVHLDTGAFRTWRG